MDLYTTIAVLSVAGGYALYLCSVAYLRLLQYRATKATELRRDTCTVPGGPVRGSEPLPRRDPAPAANPLKLAHIPDPGGYEYSFQNPRGRIEDMVGRLRIRHFRC